MVKMEALREASRQRNHLLSGIPPTRRIRLSNVRLEVLLESEAHRHEAYAGEGAAASRLLSLFDRAYFRHDGPCPIGTVPVSVDRVGRARSARRLYDRR